MDKFNFKLEKVLDYKKIIETDKKGEYGKAKQKLIKEENVLEDYNRYKDNIKNERNLSIYKTNIANLKLYNDHLLDIDRHILEQERVVDKTKEKLEIAKDELLEATKEKKTFEKLKENRYEEYLYSIKKEEEKIIDTIVTFKGSAQQ
ncbi:flagellar export protein FliJ [Sporanaerobacter acetigenes]|uniref:Flagellar FliJ protein n=1 Tax=Sporanaerobacter acetigenes DSM 13106 TaxID=1123281 RepID=A0A1M5XZT4_9FIRM|nr:flagellar export protein FliJ [Sporanaerobacter acetigenes]SHI05226.1 flagellar FliJ protein [Sporanaerobacter acetigenes DSM 13106]